MKKEVEYYIDNQHFFHAVYADTVKREQERKDRCEVQSNQGECSFLYHQSWIDYTQLQDGFAIRNLQEARYWSQRILSPEGTLLLDEVHQAIACYQTHLYHLGPERQFDTPRRQHLLRMLCKLRDDAQLRKKLESLRLPSSPLSLQLIADSLGYTPSEPMTHTTFRQAVLSGLLSYLRQNVGSCFATAPAIMILRDQPLNFLHDIDDLMQMNLLRRVVDGKEYVAPISRTPGIGDLKRPFPLQRNNKRIWFSPGLIAAFDATGLLWDCPTIKSKGERIHSWSKKVFSMKELNFTQYMATPEELITRLLLSALDLTLEDLHRYQTAIYPILGAGGSWIAANSYGAKKGQKEFKLPQSKDQRLKLFSEMLAGSKRAFSAVTDHPLVKTWEFTLASFAESRSDASSWNVYTCLGGETRHHGGIGELLHKQIQENLDQSNQEITYLEERLEPLRVQLRYLEGRMSRVSEKEASWIKSEYQGLVSNVNALQTERDEAEAKSQCLTQLFPFLMNHFYRTLADHFQEVYDPDLHVGAGENPYDDSPAGFRLLQKNGRTNPLAWTAITTPAEYIEALARCLTAFEYRLTDFDELKPVKSILSHMWGSLIQYVRTEQFLIGAFERMAEEHQVNCLKPVLERIEEQPIRPWVYSSGGSMEVLTATYYKLADRVTTQEKEVLDSEELLFLLLEFYKGLTYDQMKIYLNDPGKGMLSYSPTHAFILLPGSTQFAQGWQLIHRNSYTWFRDTLILPQREWWDQIILNDAMQERLLTLVAKDLPSGVKEAFLYAVNGAFSGASLLVSNFRQELLSAISRRVQAHHFPTDYLIELFDSACYRHLPMINVYEIFSCTRRILDLLPDEISNQQEQIIELLDRHYPSSPKYHYLTSEQFQNIVKGLILLATGKCFTQLDYHYLVCKAARDLNLAAPEPLIFADTNWTRDLFAFVLNPGTGQLQLWRTDYIGLHARPMQCWEKYFRGDTTYPWGIYSKPYEYGQ
jgi:hypothetical protein